MNSKTSWFEQLTGFQEASPALVRQNLVLDNNTLTSKVNGRVMTTGQLEIPSLGDLRERLEFVADGQGQLKVREIVADVQQLHIDSANAGALFQVASQFNLLEMVSPNVTPKQGVTIYEDDPTQGPACAIAAGAGTIYRNYFAPVDGQFGQTDGHQIDCLADLGQALGNENEELWSMRNGYAIPSAAGLNEVARRISGTNYKEMDELRQQLRIGLMWDTQVTLNDCDHLVSQAYCSALSVAYSRHPARYWEPFARLVLEASYEATLAAAVLNHARGGTNKLYLTLLGGGAFGNKTEWIIGGLWHALRLYKDWDLDVAVVSHGQSNEAVKQLVEEMTL